MKIIIMFFLIISNFITLYAESREDYVDKIIEKSLVDEDNNKIDENSVFNELKDLKDKMKASNRQNITTTNQVCEIKVIILKMFSKLFAFINPIAITAAIILLFFSIKKLFIDNHQQEKNGINSGIIKAIWWFFFSLILFNFKSFMEWWDENVISRFGSSCDGTSAKSGSIYELFVELGLNIMFMMMTFFGVVMIILGIFELTRKQEQGKRNRVVGAIGVILFGIFLIDHQNIINWMMP